MCISLFAWQTVPGYRLIYLSNRDEFHHRPTEKAGFWKKGPEILAGRDLDAGGTWLGLNPNGRFANITNYRDFRLPQHENAPSRGKLVTDFLSSIASSKEELEILSPEAGAYNPFSLIAGTVEELFFFSNQGNGITRVEPGFHGLLNTSWPKVDRGKERLKEIVEADPENLEDLFDLMRSTEQAPDHLLPDTGRDLEFERWVSPIFIEHPVYGTRCTTILRIAENGHAEYLERSFDPSGSISGEVRYDLQLPV